MCPHDPRTLGERRSQALGVVAAGGTALPCICGRPDCPAAGADARAEAIQIHILTDHHPDTTPLTDPAPDAGPEPGTAADPAPDLATETGADSPVPEPSDPQPAPEPRGTTGSGLAVIGGGGIVPTPLLAELIRLGVAVRQVPNPAQLCSEPRYRPSAKLAGFVRSRDLTCCFPGCDQPAERCDIDREHGGASLSVAV